MNRVRRGAVAALLAAAGLAGCTEVSTDPQFPVSLQFDSLPALAVVIGDTMRGPDLEPTRLPVAAFSGSGSAVSDSLVRVVGIDTGSVKSFTVASGFFLTGTQLNSAVRVVAQAGGLQSQPQTFAVVKVPTSLSRPASDASDSLVYNALDTLRRFSLARTVLRAADTTRLKGLRVKYRIVSFTDSLLDSIKLVAPIGGKPVASALMDDSVASVQVVAWPKKRTSGTTTTTVIGTGTVTIEASHKALGAQVPGSPLQFTIRLVPFRLTP